MSTSDPVAPAPLELLRIFLSPGHSFYGRHGLAAAPFAMEEVPRVRALAGRGLEGDRFLDFKPDYKGQVTLFSEEVWKACSEVFLKPDLPPWAFRRNLLTRGDADLTRWIGRRFRIQEVVLEGTGECAPCEWMEQAVAPGAWEWLKGRGGLRCRILTDGLLRTDHPA